MRDITFCLLFMVQPFCFFSYINITNGHFKIVCSQKLIKSLTDIAEHICHIKRRSDGNFFPKCANKHFFVSSHINYRVNDMGIKMSQKQFPSGM